MDLEIVELAKRMREALFASYPDFNEKDPWEGLAIDDRLAWVAAAAVARPDLVEGLKVGPEHWLAPLYGKTP